MLDLFNDKVVSVDTARDQGFLNGMGIVKHDAEFGHVNCPLQLHYGLKDPHIPRPEIDAVTRAAARTR